MATEERLLIDAMAAAREQLQRLLLFRACADYRHWRAPPGNRSPPNFWQNASASSDLAKQNTTKSRSSPRREYVSGATERVSAKPSTTSLLSRPRTLSAD